MGLNNDSLPLPRLSLLSTYILYFFSIISLFTKHFQRLTMPTQTIAPSSPSPKPENVLASSLKRIRPDIGGITLSRGHDDITKKQRLAQATACLTRTNALRCAVKISSSFTTYSKVAPTLAPTKKAADAGSPKLFLQSISQLCKAPFKPDIFSKPTEAQLAGYDIHVVSAIRTSNLDKLKELHQAGKTMNACNQFGESLIHMACRRGDVNIVKFMLSCKDVKVNVRDDYGRTPLHDACWTSTPNFDVMELLLEVIAPELLLAEDVRGHTPFCYARREHWAEWVEFLDKHKDMLEGNGPKQVTG
jgi:hypothetical protein